MTSMIKYTKWVKWRPNLSVGCSTDWSVWCVPKCRLPCVGRVVPLIHNNVAFSWSPALSSESLSAATITLVLAEWLGDWTTCRRTFSSSRPGPRNGVKKTNKSHASATQRNKHCDRRLIELIIHGGNYVPTCAIDEPSSCRLWSIAFELLSEIKRDWKVKWGEIPRRTPGGVGKN